VFAGVQRFLQSIAIQAESLRRLAALRGYFSLLGSLPATNP
jgi:hypothetical protein